MIRAELLGPVRLLTGDTPVDIGGVRARAVFAVLAVHSGRPVARDQLIDAVWGAHTPKTVANQLQIAVHRVRAALGGDGHRLLRLEPAGYVLGLPRTDLADFRRHAAEGTAAARRGDWHGARESFHAAAALWRGPLAGDLDAPGLDDVRATVDEERLTVLEHRMVTDIAAGHPSPVIAETTGLLGRYPLRERLWHLRVLALAMAGRTAEAAAGHALAVRTLAEATGLDPGRELRDLGTALGTDLAPAIDGVRAWLAGTRRRARPMELPAEIRDFVGRERELAALAAALRGGGVVTVTGLGGIGKTALAARAARTVLDAFPDGCLFTDLRGADDEPRDPHGVLGAFLRSLGVSADAVPAGLDDRVALYRSVLAGRRVLVVLDNAVDAAHVTPLLPGSGTVLVTSRNSLAGLDAADHVLGSLTDAEAAALVTRLSGRVADSGDIATLVELTGRLPLAVRIVAARMSRRRDLDVRRMLARLADEQGRLDELADGDRRVRSCIDIGYRRLGEDARRMLRAAAWLPVGEFSLGTLMGFTGLPLAAAERVAGELEDAQFLTHAAPGGATAARYAVHDLVRLFARGEPADEAARVRGFRALLASVIAADGRRTSWQFLPPDVPPGLPEPDEAAAGDPRGWYDAQRELIAAAPGEMCRIGEVDAAWRLVGFALDYFDRAYLVSELASMSARLQAAGDRADAYSRVNIDHIRGTVLRFEVRFAEAVPLLRAARAGFRRHGEPLRALGTCFELATTYKHLGKGRLAEATSDWADAVLAGLEPSPVTVALAGWTALARANRMLGDPEREYAFAGRALAAFTESGDLAGRANALAGCGAGNLKLGRFDAAIDLYLQAQDAHAAIGEWYGVAYCSMLLANARYLSGDLDAAEAAVREILDETREVVAMRELRLQAMRIGSNVMRARGRLDEAYAQAEEALALAREWDLPLRVLDLLLVLGKTALLAADFERARFHTAAGLAQLARGDRADRRFGELLAAIEKAEAEA
ncbi:SARP family transcriptional regulator [Actinorhabdospora filicis]|uniref:SARP family transcriptional regulator n=1 Tax=Actinorhabdospora filicis TaxID=1785913 RepID=A0A9W6SPV8_9ACTN|nr:BTAD domain-containing putative transcriptional regulator [Actinorhabdospora filicis]GLZ80026.1 SARP family transcriptional regulator [Actinorhabdospora filicis]